MPTFMSSMNVLESFASPRTHRYSAFRTMPILLGFHIGTSGCLRFHVRRLFPAFGALCMPAFASIYFNCIPPHPYMKTAF